MTKESLIWLAIRIAGLVFVYLAVVSTVSFVSTYITLSQTSAIANYQTPALNALSDRAASLASLVLVGQFLYIVFNGVIAGYLLRGGKLVFDVLNREGVNDVERSGMIDTLHLGGS